jgi:hypothetical protein
MPDVQKHRKNEGAAAARILRCIFNAASRLKPFLSTLWRSNQSGPVPITPLVYRPGRCGVRKLPDCVGNQAPC